MILGSPELDEFVVEPCMKLGKFNKKLINKISLDHPYKILLKILYKYYPSYSNEEENDANPNYDGYDDNIVDFYFRMLDDYNRYGIAFERKFQLFPGNKLGVFKNEKMGKTVYHLVKNSYDKKILLFNNVKTIDLNEYDSGEKPLTEEEKQKRDIIKKQTNKKLQVAMMSPDFYNRNKLFKNTFEILSILELFIRKFNNCMTGDGFNNYSINFTDLNNVNMTWGGIKDTTIIIQKFLEIPPPPIFNL